MERLIDSDALLYEYCQANGCNDVIDQVCPNCFTASLIANAQTVDAVEVVHGRWEEMHYEGGILDGTNFDRCSVCGYERVFDDPALKTVFKYCPNCGAKMDGDVNG